MENLEFDLTTRVENKPADCGKRVSYNEITFGSDYYVLYNQALHRVTVCKMVSDGNAPAFKIRYSQTEEVYLGEKQPDDENCYIVNLEKYFPLFYEIR